MTGAPDVSIVTPTRGRPASLERALRSVLAQTGIDPGSLELVVVDNDAGGSAETVVARLRAEAPFPLHYVREPRPGVANARNAGLAKASGKLIAFIDDDEEAPPGWLAALISVHEALDADVVFGPVRAGLPDSIRRHRAYLERFFSRVGPAEAQILDGHFGCGDSLIRRAALPDQVQPFDVAQNQIGGEDDILFLAMRERGARFAWAPEAWVWEHPEPARLRLGYALRRAFAYGQAPTYFCMASRPRRPLGAVFWMGVGLIQALVFGALAALKWLAHAPDRAFALDRAARGLGKLLWFPPFKQRFYGLPSDLAHG